MRRILIDTVVEARANEYAEVMKGKKPEKKKWAKDKSPKERLIELYKSIRDARKYDVKAALYVYNIISLYENLLVLHPDAFALVYQSYFQQWDDILKEPIEYGGNTRPFYEHIITCMGYAEIRSTLMREYMRDQHIKACVYCNAQYAVTTEEFEENGVKKRIGTYQFDHLWPESDFPFLCTSYFNLQPSCPTCNQTKLTRRASFNLYTSKEAELDIFHFELTPDKAVTAYVAEDMDKLEVKLKSDNTSLLDNHQKLFHIDLIYAEHIDVVKRIIVVLRSNEKYYRLSLNDALSGLFPNGVEDPEYFFFGFYMKKDDIHMQPLTKLTQDIVSTLKRID